MEATVKMSSPSFSLSLYFSSPLSLFSFPFPHAFQRGVLDLAPADLNIPHSVL